jgi:hypothetical protein
MTEWSARAVIVFGALRVRHKFIAPVNQIGRPFWRNLQSMPTCLVDAAAM